MSNILKKFDQNNFKPILKYHRQFNIEQAIAVAMHLNHELDEIMVDHYVKIPHALASIFSNAEELKIDVERTFDDNDPYILEESQLAPPESHSDPYWRRNLTRLTYLISQFFVAALLQKIPDDNFMQELQEKHEQYFDVIQKFLEVGLHTKPKKRYQSFTDQAEGLQWLREKVIHIDEKNQEIEPSLFSTQEMRAVPRSYYKKVVTKRILRETTTKVINATKETKYEVQVWNPLYKNAAKIMVETPAKVTLGRRVTPTVNKNDPDTTITGHQVEKKDGIYHYTIFIDGDRCLSRKHIELTLPLKIQDKPKIADLGSTHGTVLFKDSSRNMMHSSSIYPGGESDFFYPQDQHIKIGNTYLRVRPNIKLEEESDNKNS